VRKTSAISWLSAAALVAPALALAGQTPVDTGYPALQRRGRMVMGVDQYTSMHRFDERADGGRIVLTRSPQDTAGVRIIRQHLAEVARAFRAGDFSDPAAVHAHELPGVAVMRERRRFIAYTVDTLPGGGAIRLRTRDPAALKAVRQFLAAQRHEHHAGGMVMDSSGGRP
jgi:hypothetical protein